MPVLRKLVRAFSDRHMTGSQRLLSDDYDDLSDDGSLSKPLGTPSKTTRKHVETPSVSDTSDNSEGSSGDLSPVEIISPSHEKSTKSSSPRDRTHNCSLSSLGSVSEHIPEKQGLGEFFERAQSSSSSLRKSSNRNDRASKGRSRRISSNRSVASLPAKNAAPVSPAKSVRERPSRRTVESLPKAHMSAPTVRKQKVSLSNFPSAPLSSSSHHTAPYRKALSTRDLLKEYNNILDEYGDSTRGPRSKTEDLLEEYDEILTQYDDSARADRRTHYSSGW